MQPLPNADGTPGRIGRFQAFSRTPITFTAQLNLLVQNGKGRVLADPRITTLSGRTASIRAGDTISILTTTAGNAGTIATTQVQSFQTGVTLDITPSVTPDGGITVVLHPVVNSLIGTNAGVPEISTRDTQTTVHLQDDETLVIGGLIQENETRTTTKVPLLGRPAAGRPRVSQRERPGPAQRAHHRRNAAHREARQSRRLARTGAADMPTPPALPTLRRTRISRPRADSCRHAAASGGANLGAGRDRDADTLRLRRSPAVRRPRPPAADGVRQTNVFTFGSAPQSNFAKPTDPVQIFYATLSPTVVSNGTSVRLAVVTTTNATTVKLQVGSQSIGLSQTAAGQWVAAFPFPATAVPVGQTSVTVTIVASRSDGTSASVPIQLNVQVP